MCKNLLVLNLRNEGDNLILETNFSNEHLSAVLKIKEGEKLYKSVLKVSIKENATFPRMEKEILT